MVLLLLLQLLATQDTAGFRPVFAFPVTDTVSQRVAGIGAGLVVRVRSEADAHGTHMGWSIGVYREPVGPESRNLLYASNYFHGPHPSDLFAWHRVQHFFPDERILPVYRYPREIRIACVGCQIAGDSSLVHFTSGSVEIGWRRLRRPVMPGE
jgi:hypothetical protein